jgi:mRNA interferase RelE/StbE
MYELRITQEAQANFQALPLPMQVRVQKVFGRLVRWPDISGAKPLKGTLKGAYRVRTGDWRVLFKVDEQSRRVTVFRIAHRRDVYEE